MTVFVVIYETFCVPPDTVWDGWKVGIRAAKVRRVYSSGCVVFKVIVETGVARSHANLCSTIHPPDDCCSRVRSATATILCVVYGLSFCDALTGCTGANSHTDRKILEVAGC